MRCCNALNVRRNPPGCVTCTAEEDDAFVEAVAIGKVPILYDKKCDKKVLEIIVILLFEVLYVLTRDAPSVYAVQYASALTQ